MRGFMGPLASDAQSYLSTLSAPILGRPHLPSPGPPLQLLDGTSPSAFTSTFPQTFLKHTLDHNPPISDTFSGSPLPGNKAQGRDLSCRPRSLPGLLAFVQVAPAWKLPYCGRRR